MLCIKRVWTCKLGGKEVSVELYSVHTVCLLRCNWQSCSLQCIVTYFWVKYLFRRYLASSSEYALRMALSSFKTRMWFKHLCPCKAVNKTKFLQKCWLFTYVNKQQRRNPWRRLMIIMIKILAKYHQLYLVHVSGVFIALYILFAMLTALCPSLA